VNAKLVLVVATTNAGKRQELQELLGGGVVELRSLLDYPGAPDVVEDGRTYLDNARKKARSAAQWTGAPVLADDSGLEVDALDGAPGLYSARYAGDDGGGPAHISKLLRNLEGVAALRRSARFRCVIVVACPHDRELVVEGTCAGRITEEPVGTQGFGYDPVFFYEPAGCTFAQMPSSRKQQVSHRAVACAALRPQLEDFLRGCPSCLNP